MLCPKPAKQLLATGSDTVFMLKNLNKEAMDTERCLGNSCSSRTSYNIRQNIKNAHIDHLNTKIQNAISQQSLIVCVIDDYHCIRMDCVDQITRKYRRPNTCAP